MQHDGLTALKIDAFDRVRSEVARRCYEAPASATNVRLFAERKIELERKLLS
jgi:hypothetical protein